MLTDEQINDHWREANRSHAMDEREMLEMAALAFWGDEIDDVCSIRWLETDRAIGYTHGDNQDHNGIDLELVWNPLADDGDAFRLAVKLGICFGPNFDGDMAVCFGREGRNITEDFGDDPCAATRLAIIRAAAAIGQQMKEQT